MKFIIIFLFILIPVRMMSQNNFNATGNFKGFAIVSYKKLNDKEYKKAFATITPLYLDKFDSTFFFVTSWSGWGNSSIKKEKSIAFFHTTIKLNVPSVPTYIKEAPKGNKVDDKYIQKRYFETISKLSVSKELLYVVYYVEAKFVSRKLTCDIQKNEDVLYSGDFVSRRNLSLDNIVTSDKKNITYSLLNNFSKFTILARNN